MVSRPTIANNFVNYLLTFSRCLYVGRFLSTKVSSKEGSFNNASLHPSFVTGLIDGEGSFAVNIRKNSKFRLG